MLSRKRKISPVRFLWGSGILAALTTRRSESDYLFFMGSFNPSLPGEENGKDCQIQITGLVIEILFAVLQRLKQAVVKYYPSQLETVNKCVG